MVRLPALGLEPAHLLGDKDRMVNFRGRVLEAGVDVRVLEVREILEDLLPRNLGSKQIEDVLYPDPHSTDAGPPPALFRIEGDSFVHVESVVQCGVGVKGAALLRPARGLVALFQSGASDLKEQSGAADGRSPTRRREWLEACTMWSRACGKPLRVRHS